MQPDRIRAGTVAYISPVDIISRGATPPEQLQPKTRKGPLDLGYFYLLK